MQYRFWVARLTLLILLASWRPGAYLGMPPQSHLLNFLRDNASLTQSDLDDLEDGRVVVQLPRTNERHEVASLGIMRLDISADFLIAQKRDIVRFKKSDNVLQVGTFSNPPRIEDLAALTIDDDEIESLRRCRVHSCDFKLAAGAIERFRTEIDWSAPGYRQRAAALLREVLLGYAQSYLKEGDAALGQYNDKSQPLGRAAELRTLIQAQPYMYRYSSELQRYLENFPNFRPQGAEDFIYWSKEKFGPKPVISLTHVTIYKKTQQEETIVWIASKGIYASHYLDASVGVSTFVEIPGQSRSYLIYVNRSTVDALRGFLGGVTRALMAGSLRNGIVRNMELARQRLESEYRRN